MLRKIRQPKSRISNFIDNFSENCDGGGQNLLNLKAPNPPPSPLSKGGVKTKAKISFEIIIISSSINIWQVRPLLENFFMVRGGDKSP